MTARLPDVVPATPSSRRRIVGFNPSLSAFMACGLLGMFAFSWGMLASPPNEASNILEFVLPMCLVVTTFCLVGTCRLVLDPAGFIDVIDPLVVRRVPVSELVEAEHDEGLRLRVVSGRRIGSVAYGSSLAGMILHYPRSVRASRRIEAAVGGFRDTEELPAWQQDSVTSKLRARAYLITLGINVLLIGGTFVINTAWTAVQH